MGKWTKTAGLLFLAAASVYSSQAIVAAVEGRATPAIQATARGTDVKLAATHTAAKPAAAERIFAAPDTTTDVKILDESTDPFANAPATQPSTTAGATGTTGAAAPTTQPGEGRSVSSSEVSVSDAGTVEIHVNDANLVEVLRMLSLQSQKNIVASKDVHGTITANLYDVTVREALDAILHANGYAYREKGNFIYVYTTAELETIEKSEKKMSTQVFRVYYTPAADAAIMIKPVLSAAGGQVAVSTPSKVGISSAPAGGGGDAYSNNDVLVVTDYPENLEAVRKLLADLDHRPQQILLEATILRATLNEDNALGVDFNIMGGVDMAGVVNGGAQITNSGVAAPVAVPTTPGAAAKAGTLLGDGSVVGPNPVSSVGTGNAFTSPINGGLKVGYVTDSVSVFVSALEQTTDTTILANPKVLALNKQQGEVFVGNEDGYYTTLTTETTTSQSVESLKTGTRLIFRPYIGNDGYVRLEVHPEDSDGQVKANGLPSKSTTEVTSNVMVKDGHTIVIGGLFRESTVSGRSQVPFLGNIPLAGALFRNQRDRTVREEVIILLTPHVIKDDSAYSRLSEEELKHTEDMRVGSRKGLMPWGRERLAQGWYEAARKEMNKPNPNRGLVKFQLDCATNLVPTFTDAIDLKEQVTGHVVSEADGSSIRSFVRRAMIQDVAPATMPSTAVPATQPIDAATADGATTQPADVAAKSEEHDFDPAAPTASAIAMPESAEASTDEGTLALPKNETPVDTKTEAAPAIETPAAPASTEPSAEASHQPDYLPTETSESVEVTNATASATQPSTQPFTPSVTVVTPLEETDESASATGTRSSSNNSTSTEKSDTTPISNVTVVPLEEEPADSK